jgi:hypothetical protein
MRKLTVLVATVAVGAALFWSPAWANNHRDPGGGAPPSGESSALLQRLGALEAEVAALQETVTGHEQRIAVLEALLIIDRVQALEAHCLSLTSTVDDLVFDSFQADETVTYRCSGTVSTFVVVPYGPWEENCDPIGTTSIDANEANSGVGYEFVFSCVVAPEG